MKNVTGAPLYRWKEEYSVHVEDLDDQHHRLINTLGDLHAGVAEGQENEALARILNDLIHFTDVHFADEEAVMRKRGYPRLAVHMQEHRRLQTIVYKLRSDLEAGRMKINEETLTFLESWLHDHMRGMDQDYARFFARQK